MPKQDPRKVYTIICKFQYHSPVYGDLYEVLWLNGFHDYEPAQSKDQAAYLAGTWKARAENGQYFDATGRQTQAPKVHICWINPPPEDPRRNALYKQVLARLRDLGMDYEQISYFLARDPLAPGTDTYFGLLLTTPRDELIAIGEHARWGDQPDFWINPL